MSNAAEGENRILVYDYVRNGGDLLIDREVDESNESYNHRISLYNKILSPNASRATNSTSS
jgi:hypothetical protein